MKRLGMMARYGAIGATVGVVLVGPMPHLQATTALAAGADAPSAVGVSMKDFAYSPATIHVRAGGTVTWTYDEVPTDPMGCESPLFQAPSPAVCPGHSVTAVTNGADGKPLFDSGVHRADGFPYQRVFATAGTFDYFCVVHGGANSNNPLTHMDGVVIVDPAAADVGAGAGAGAAGNSVLGGDSSHGTTGGLAATGGTPLAAGGALLLLVALLANRRLRTEPNRVACPR